MRVYGSEFLVDVSRKCWIRELEPQNREYSMEHCWVAITTPGNFDSHSSEKKSYRPPRGTPISKGRVYSTSRLGV